jgi:hypothetical protein
MANKTLPSPAASAERSEDDATTTTTTTFSYTTRYISSNPSPFRFTIDLSSIVFAVVNGEFWNETTTFFIGSPVPDIAIASLVNNMEPSFSIFHQQC